MIVSGNIQLACCLAVLPLSPSATPSHLGSVRQMTDSSGTPTYAASYDPYGNPLDQTSPTATNQGYTGQQTDSDGLIYLRARYYNPSMGTFLTPDPVMASLSRSGSMNGYGYVEGNPTNLTDPSGKFFGVDDLIFAAIVAGAFIGGLAYGTYTGAQNDPYFYSSNFGDRLGAVGRAIPRGLVWGGGSSIAAGILTAFSGIVSTSLDVAGDAFSAGAEWLDANVSNAAQRMLLAGGTGVLAEWGNQVRRNVVDNNMDIFRAVGYGNLNKKGIIASGVFAAGTAAIWEAGDVFDTINDLGLLRVLDPESFGSELPGLSRVSGLVYGTAITGLSYGASLTAYNGIRKGKQGSHLLDDWSWADLNSNIFFDNMINYVTVSFDLLREPSGLANPASFWNRSLARALVYGNINLAGTWLQNKVSSLYDPTSTGVCQNNASLGTSLGTVGANFLWPNSTAGSLFASWGATSVSNLAGTECNGK
jgi:RHS repeat-associated protein